MTSRELVVGRQQAGTALQRLLHDVQGHPHSTARGLILGGAVRVNGRVVLRPGHKLSEGDRVEVVREAGRSYRAPKRPRKTEGFRILHEDRDLVVVDKEAGLLVVRAPSSAAVSLQELLEEHDRGRGVKHPRLYPVHRIDRFTSGLVVLARNRKAALALRRQFERRTPERVYLALAEGRVEPDEGRLVDRLLEDPRSLKVRPTRRAGAGKEAISHYRVLERFSNATLLEIRLESGRRNQIRVQLASRGHPLVGDVAYGNRSPWIGRTALHAHRIRLEHPTRATALSFVSDPPRDFLALLERLRNETV